MSTGVEFPDTLRTIDTPTPPAPPTSTFNVRNYFAGYAPAGGIEVPSTLPTLTWDVGTPQALGTPTDLDDLMDAIDAAVAATSDGWRVLDKKLSTDPAPWNGGASVGILIGGPVGSPVENCRFVLATSTADSLESVARASTISGYGNNDAQGLWITFSPDAGASGFDAFGSGASDVSDGEFLASGPGAAERVFKGERETGLSSFRQSPSTTGIDSITAWANAEILMLIPIRGTTVFDVFGGATIVPPSDDAAEADGRVYGMHHGNIVGLETAGGRFPGGNTFANTAKSYVFRPSVPASCDFVEVAGYTNINNIDSLQDTPSGPKLAFPLILQQCGASKQTFGWLRQIGLWGLATHGDPVTDKDGATVGTLLSGSTAAGVRRGWAVTNIGNQG